MSLRRGSNRSAITPVFFATAVAFALLFGGQTAQAALIGVEVVKPTIFFDNQGTYSYDSTANIFSIEDVTDPLFLSTGGTLYSILEPRALSLQIEVDETGSFVSSIADLQVTGDDFNFDGTSGSETLLTATVFDFGFQDGAIDQFDMLLIVTGGSLVTDDGLFALNQTIGLTIGDDRLGFPGDFEGDFSGQAKGAVGAIAAVPEPGAALLFGSGLIVTFAGGRARRSRLASLALK